MQFDELFFGVGCAPADPGGRFRVHNDVLSRPVLSSGPFQENPAATCIFVTFLLFLDRFWASAQGHRASPHPRGGGAGGGGGHSPSP